MQLRTIGIGNVKGAPRIGPPLLDGGADQDTERGLERSAVDGSLERVLLSREPDLALSQRGFARAQRGSPFLHLPFEAVFGCLERRLAVGKGDGSQFSHRCSLRPIGSDWIVPIPGCTPPGRLG